MVRKPCASTAGAACRGFARGCAGTRTVSTRGEGSWEPGAGTAAGSLLPFCAKYPTTPATTTATPITAGSLDRRRAGVGAGLRDFAAGSGVVGTPVISVGASAVARARGRAALRGLAGDATRRSRPTGGAESPLLGESRAGFLARAPAIATLGGPGGPGRLVLPSG